MLNLIGTRLKININFKKMLAVQLVTFVLGFILIGAFNSYEEEYKLAQKINVGIKNKDNNIATELLLNNFKNTEHFSGLFELKTIDSDDDGNLAINNGEVDALVILPEGFADGLYHFENKVIELITKSSIPTKNAVLSETLRGFSDYVKAVDMASYVYNDRLSELDLSAELEKSKRITFNMELLKATLGRSKYFEIQTISDLPVVSSIEYYLAALPISIMCFISIISGIRKLKEDNLGVAVRIELSGVGHIKQAIAFYISEAINAIFLVFPVIVYSAYKSGLSYAMRLALSAAIAYVFYAAIWRIIAQLSKSKETLSIACISISFLSCLIAGGIVPYLLLPVWVKGIATSSINFILCRFVLSSGGLASILPFLFIFVLLFLADISIGIGTHRIKRRVQLLIGRN